MGRHGPKIVILIAIAVVVVAMYVIENRPPAASQAPTVVYVNPNIAPSPAAGAPAP